MPTERKIEDFRKQLLEELQSIENEETLGKEGQKTVLLDQQSVGRLSRMDALQQQAMAQATARRRAAQRSRILAALKRMDEGEFGYCTDCGEDIETSRLALDPTVPRCLSCTAG